MTVPGDAKIENLGADLLINNSGDLSLESSDPLRFSTVEIEGGTLSAGGGDLTVTSSMTWDGGAHSALGKLIISAQAALTMASADDDFVGLTLDNFGTSTWQTVNVTGGGGAMYVNEPGGTLDVQIAGSNLDGVTFDNFGTVTWSTGSFGVAAGTVFNNERGAILTTECESELGSGGILNNLAGATIIVNNDDQHGGMNMGEIVNNDGVINLDSGVLTLGFF